MNDPVPDSTSQEGVSDLHRWLGYGAFAALVAALLSCVSSALTLGGWPQGGFSLTEVINLGVLLPLALVLVAYYKASLTTGTAGLRRSALGMFGMLVVLDLGNLNVNEDGPRWWNVVIWVVLALATGLLLLVVWNLVEFEKETAEEKPAAGSDPPAGGSPAPASGTGTPAGADTPKGETAGGGKWAGGVVGVLGVAGVFALRVGLKVAGVRAARAVGADGLEALVLLAMLLLAAVFLVWFAVAKIRLRRVLGPLAGVAGLLELLLIPLCGLLVVGMLSDVAQVVEQAGVNEQAAEANFKAVETTWTLRAASVSIIVNIIWATLTAGVLLSYRARVAADQNGPDPFPE